MTYDRDMLTPCPECNRMMPSPEHRRYGRCELCRKIPKCRFCGLEDGAHNGACIAMRLSLHSGKRCGVLDEINARCRLNDQRHGGPAHDDIHTPVDWVAFIDRWNSKAAVWQAGQPVAFSPDFRSRMLDVAALAVAAIEAFDRKHRGSPASTAGGRGG